MHAIAVLAYPGVLLFDLATPIEVFGRVRLADGSPGYRVEVVASHRTVTAGGVRLTASAGLDELRRFDTIMVPGIEDPRTPAPPPVLAALREAFDRGTRLASLCVGAFVLAQAGVLDGRRATTHWNAGDEFRSAHPRVELDTAVLYVDEGGILTSAGATAGVDLCLHLVARDYGAAVAADAARAAVVPLRREGGQAQFIPAPVAGDAGGSRLAAVLEWLEEEYARDLGLAEIAARATLSVRTLNRRFHDLVGMSPMQWLTSIRIRRARELLEAGDLPVEQIARRVGFASTAHFRQQFTRSTGVPPRSYRSAFRARST